MKDKHITNNTQQSNQYNHRLVAEVSDASPAGNLDAAIPIDPRTNVIISQKDGINHFTGCDTSMPQTVLDVINSTAGHEAANHALYANTYEDARGVFAQLLDSQCLIETVVDIYYTAGEQFVEFEPADRSSAFQSTDPVELFVEQHTESAEKYDEQDSETDSSDEQTLSSEIECDTLASHFRFWIANTTTELPPDATWVSRMLHGIRGLEKVTRIDDQDGQRDYWQLDGRVWNLNRE